MELMVDPSSPPPGSAPGPAPGARGPAARRVRGPGAWSRGLRYMAVCAFFLSVMTLLVKLAGRHLPDQEMVLARSAIMLGLSWLWLTRAGRPWLRVSQRPLLLLRGLFGYAALSCFYHALVRLPLGDANLIQLTSPAFTGLLAFWVLRERLRLREVSVVGLSLAGVALVARPTLLFGGASALPLDAVGIALLGAIMSACAYVTVRRLDRQDPLVVVFYFSLVATVGSVIASAPRLVWPEPREWLLLLGIGATTQIAQVFLTRALQLELAGRATAVGYLQVVFAGVWGLLFLGEIPDVLSFAGFVLIAGSTLVLASTGASGPPRIAAALEDP